MRRYDARYISVEDYRALRRLIREQRAAAVLIVTPVPDWPATIDAPSGTRRRIQFHTIN